jgi:hypothetical protein
VVGRRLDILPDIAATLEQAHPLAATILYRVLLDDIPACARSKAFGRGARYLATLDRLALDADATYRARLATVSLNCISQAVVAVHF